MTKHYVLTLDPSAEYDWDRCVLRDPITAERPELAQLVAEAILTEGYANGKHSGSYLLSVNIEVQVLEKAPNPQPKPFVAGPALSVHRQPEELVA